MEAVKAYWPESSSLGAGQVLQCPYDAEKAKLVVREMADALSLDLVEKHLVTDQIVITVGYDIENLTDPERRKKYRGEMVTDRYGRQIPKHAHGTENMENFTSSTQKMVEAASVLYDRIVDKNLLIRRINITANNIVEEKAAPQKNKSYQQLDLFTDAEESEKQRKKAEACRKEKQLQKAILQIQKKYGKNAVLKGTNFLEGATMKERNNQVGGHRA